MCLFNFFNKKQVVQMVTFKEQVRLPAEFQELGNKNKELYDLVNDLADWVKKTFKKDIVITMIFRMQSEQDILYKDDPAYQKKPFKSPHQFWHGVDIRSKIFTKDEIAAIENYLNSKYNNGNYYKWTAKCHTIIGGAEHFHLQFCKK